MSQQHASVSPGWICSDDCLCCHSDPICYLTQSQYTDTRLTSPSVDPRIPGAWQGSHWSTNFEVSGLTPPPKNLQGKQELNPGQLFLRQTPYHLVDKEVQQQAKNISGIDLLRQLRKPNMTDAADQTFNLSIQGSHSDLNEKFKEFSRSFQGIFFKSQGVFLTQRNMTNDSDSVTHDCTDTEKCYFLF